MLRSPLDQEAGADELHERHNTTHMNPISMFASEVPHRLQQLSTTANPNTDSSIDDNSTQQQLTDGGIAMERQLDENLCDEEALVV
jgi:hypothetical protein